MRHHQAAAVINGSYLCIHQCEEFILRALELHHQLLQTLVQPINDHSQLKLVIPFYGLTLTRLQ